jgi:Tfp pilus assembly protein PilF
MLYSPAFRGQFVFDDAGLPFHRTMRVQPLSTWVAGVRPVLMTTYWLNMRVWGDNPGSYHVMNALIHGVNAVLVFLILTRLLRLAGWAHPEVLRTSALGCLIFLVHPLQTESVSYVAGRSESLSAFFQLLAYVVFLYRRREAISFVESALVLGLFLLAVTTKENAVSLVGVVILTDLFWQAPCTSAGVRRNWKLYSLMVPGAVISVTFIFRMLATAPSAGLSLQTVTWLQYWFTESRAIFEYIRLAAIPAGLSIDHDFAVSHTIFEHGAIIWVLLLIGIAAAGWHLRRLYPLGCFGLFFFLLTLAPTSSIIPIADPLVERRMYLPLLGLILIVIELWRRLQFPSRVNWGLPSAIVLLLSGTCYARNVQWGHPEQLFAAAAAQSIHNFRPYLQLTEVLVHEHNCDPAIPYLKRADKLFPGDFNLEVSWGWALECQGRLDEALKKLQLAARLNPSSSLVYEWIGLLFGEMGKSVEAGEALHRAVELDLASVTAHEALGLWYQSIGDLAAAEKEHAKSLAIDPLDPSARAAMEAVQSLRAAAGNR